MTTTTLLLQVLVVSACILHSHAVAPSEGDLCVESINVNSWTIVYSDPNQDIIQDAYSLDEITTETVVALLAFTAPSRENGTESRVYQVSKTHLCHFVSPQFLDLMTFYSLRLAERTKQVSLDIRTFTTCANKSWENLLYDSFALDERDGFVRLLKEPEKPYYYAILDSGVMFFIALSALCLFVMFVIILPASFYALANYAERQTRGRPGILIQVLTTINWLNVVVLPLYLAYTTFCMVSYYAHFDGTIAPLEIPYKNYTIAPFSINALYLCMSVCISFIAGFFYGVTVDYLTPISAACTIALASTLFYHLTFLLLALVDDFATALSAILVRTTALFFFYTLLPAAWQYRRSAKSAVHFCHFWLLLLVVPFLYATLILSKGHFDARHVYTASASWSVFVLCMSITTWVLCSCMLTKVFRAKRRIHQLLPKAARMTEREHNQ